MGMDFNIYNDKKELYLYLHEQNINFLSQYILNTNIITKISIISDDSSFRIFEGALEYSV